MDPVAVEVWRGDVVESVHRAHVAVVDADGSLVGRFGSPRHVSFLRSAAKPLQAVPLVASKAAAALKLTDPELAIIVGSHNGEPMHVQMVQSILKKAGLEEGQLACGRHPPFHKESAAELGDRYTPIHNNCSGKHAGMLALAKHKGWPLEGYLEPSHPVQKACLTAVADAAGVRSERIKLGVDGCGVPAFAMTLQAAARSFSLLADPDAAKSGMAEPLARIQGAMRSHPEMVAGTGRLDTKIAKATGGRVLVKAGAEAFYGAAILDAKVGVAVKVDDGAWRAVGPVIGAVLEAFGDLKEGEKEALNSDFHPVIKNHAGHAVGRMEPVLEF